jgi:hypothetical protein
VECYWKGIWRGQMGVFACRLWEVETLEARLGGMGGGQGG